MRNIDPGIAEKVFNEAGSHYFDNETNTYIATKAIMFQGKERDVSVAYLKNGDDVILVTIHPLKKNQKENRIKSGRWKLL